MRFYEKTNETLQGELTENINVGKKARKNEPRIKNGSKLKEKEIYIYSYIYI